MTDRVGTYGNSVTYKSNLDNYVSDQTISIEPQSEIKNPDCQAILNLQLNGTLDDVTRGFYEYCEAVPPQFYKASNANPKLVSFFVNGIMNQAESSAASAELLAQTLGRPVFRIHNDSEYFGAKDLIGAGAGLLSDEAGLYFESSAGALAEQIAFRLQDDSESIIDLHAHSQGSVILGNALGHLRKDILQIRSNSEWKKLLNSRIRITTYGAAEHSYHSPTVTEYKHRFDVVPNGTGIVTYFRDKIISWLSDTPTYESTNVARIASASHTFDTYLRDYPEFFVAENKAALKSGTIAKVIRSSILLGNFSDRTHDKIIEETLSQLSAVSGDLLYEFARDFLRYDKNDDLGKYKLSAGTKWHLLKTAGDLD